MVVTVCTCLLHLHPIDFLSRSDEPLNPNDGRSVIRAEGIF